MKILEITDSFNLHRESIFIPLATEETGNLTVQHDGWLRIVCPDAGSFEEWLIDLRKRLERMGLSKVGER